MQDTVPFRSGLSYYYFFQVENNWFTTLWSKALPTPQTTKEQIYSLIQNLRLSNMHTEKYKFLSNDSN